MFWGLVIPGGSMKYRECIRYLPFKLPETSKEANIIEDVIVDVDKILEAHSFRNSDIDNSLITRINTSLFTLYDLNSLEIEQVKQFLITFCPSYALGIKSKRT
jgi:hypothetical protein